MKLIVVDVGNTSTAVGLWSDGRVSHVAHCDGGFTEASRIVASLIKLLHSSTPSLPHSSTPPLALAYVSVVPKADRAWRMFAKAHGLAFRQVTHKCFEATTGRQLMLKIDYPKPETIGADRLADAAGAVSRYGAPVLVMDFGASRQKCRGWLRGGDCSPCLISYSFVGIL